MRNTKIITAAAILAALAGLAGCSDKATQDAKKAEATKQVLQQGTGTIRQAGQSGFQQFGQISLGNSKKPTAPASTGK